MQYQINHCGILILAAGQSNRLGRPKQLLMYQGLSLVERVAETAIASGCNPIMVVLGSSAEDISPQLNKLGIPVLVNEHWQEGMASSIREGVKAIIGLDDHIDGIVILVCDQPHMEVNHIKALLQLQSEKDLPAAACSYGGILGTPALFHQSLFKKLNELKGDVGAKKILSSLSEEIAVVEFEEGIFDIDTETDYERLLHEKKIVL